VAQFWEDFDEQAAGTFPDRFTAYQSPADWEVEVQGSDNVIARQTQVSDTASFLFYNQFSDIENAESLIQIRTNPTSGGVDVALFLAATAVSGGIEGYLCRVDRGFTGLRIARVDDAVSTTIASNSGLSLTDNVLFNLRFQKSGTTLRCKLWREIDPEPGSWSLTTTDATYTSGDAGLLVQNNDRQVYFYSVGFGTNGDSAPDAPLATVTAPSPLQQLTNQFSTIAASRLNGVLQ